MSSINKKNTQNSLAMTMAKATAESTLIMAAGNGMNSNRTNKKKTNVKTV